jgi:hypothetical protein
VLIATSPLREGDFLKVGHTILRFGFADASDGGGEPGASSPGGSSAPPASSAPAAWLPAVPDRRN